MATHGQAREDTIRDLRNHRPFRRSGFGMWAAEGAGDTGRLPEEHVAQYRADKPVYTVYSYATPIAWVTSTGLVRIPSASYSTTTSSHQSLVRAYLT